LAQEKVLTGDGDRLRRVFLNPPDAASPWTFWYWLNGNVTREGITADLEAIKANGIGAAMLFTIGGRNQNTVVDAPAVPPSPEWWDMVRHAASEAKRLNLILGMQICDGWATAGGPWITPELSMQQVVWLETDH
jgi:alpha-L-rhamnosidase